jgi:hypothetical protein
VSQFIAQRNRSRSQPFTPPPPMVATSSSSESDGGCHHPIWSAESIKESNESWEFNTMGPPCSTGEALGPIPLSVLCLTQFLKHKHAVESAYCGKTLGGNPTAASSCNLEQLKTHVDCKNAKSYVHFKWYSNRIIQELKQQLGSGQKSPSLSAIGCVNIQHWNKKMPRTSVFLQQSSKELVELCLDIEKVVSTFQVVPPDQDVIHVETLRRPDRSRIQTWKGIDEMIWTTSASLCLLAPEIIQQQKTVPFPSELARSDESWTSCGCRSDSSSPNISPPPADVPMPIQVHEGAYNCSTVTELPVYMRPAHEAMCEWMMNSSEVCGYSLLSILSSSFGINGDRFQIREEPSHLLAQKYSSEAPGSSSEYSSLSGLGRVFGPSSVFVCFHIIIDGSSLHHVDIDNIFSASNLDLSHTYKTIALFLSIGDDASDQTLLVTNCINSIQTGVLELLQRSSSLSPRLLPRIFLAFCIRGQFSALDCTAR